MLHIARDTFLHFIAGNIGSVPYHYVKRDPNRPAADFLQMNAINVTFQGFDSTVFTDIQNVVIDVVADSEDQAVTWVQTLLNLLRSAYYTTLYDYTVPATPVLVRGNLMWPRGVSFRNITSDSYFHFSCSLALEFQYS